LKLREEFTEKLLELIHAESIRKQTEIMNKDAAAGQAEEKLTHA
jgi:chorismate mutase